MKTFDVAIIGCGPAGASVAIQLKRYGFNPIVFEKNLIGGLAVNANLIENYPGFPSGITGFRFSEILKQQVKLFNINIIFKEVTSIDFKNNKFEIKTATDLFYSKYLIIASGTKPVKSTIAVESKKLSNKIYYEVFGIRNIADKNVVVIGGGDAAFDYALNLAKRNKVRIINRSRHFKCLKLLYERANSNKNIKIFSGYKLMEISETKGEKIQLNFLSTSNVGKKLYTDYLLFAIGRQSQTDFIPDKFIDKIPVYLGERRLFLVGDVKNRNFRQISISTGEGLFAAMQIYYKEKEICES